MSAFLTALTSIGSQYGEAKDQARQEKLATEQKVRALDSQQAYLDLARQAEQRQQQQFEYQKKAGDLIEFKDGRIWSVSQAKFIDPQRANPMDTLKQFISTLDPSIQKQVGARAYTASELYPNDPKAALTEVLRYADKADADKRAEEKWNREQKEREKQANDARKDQQNFRRDMMQDQHAFEQQMIDYRLQERYKYMTPQERQTFDTIKQVQPAVDRTIQFLEQTKNAQGGNLKDEDAYVFGDRSALMQHLRYRGYKFGKAQEDITQQLIKNAALIQVLGARPWMTMGRGKYIYETIAQHLPSPTDTPKLLYDKLTWLRDNVLEDAKQSLAGYVQPGGGEYQPNGGTGATPSPDVNSNDPLGVLK